jgi:hypothetical protein
LKKSWDAAKKNLPEKFFCQKIREADTARSKTITMQPLISFHASQRIKMPFGTLTKEIGSE